MPFYDYYCESNGKTVEVFHAMKKKLKTWGEVCKAAKIDQGDTPAKAHVVKLIATALPMVFRLKGLDKDEPSDRLVL